ncbi:GNAT family N-acetyltransferase [Virgibacillus halodenitrificans]|uniref:GNAT family N-acetyltransferase n=1 Tax=Virgibacillus halodenitrificans TaxID=1482 RepID=A0AAC9J0W7_VIRHA|nr:GNAT family protein [Virgibacillus halodenitrificans]APC47855.1 GNAT family N-acetyltransferase [Virgibacillus halodenitrificans]
MKYEFIPMTQQHAEIIAYHCHYEGEYSFYDMEADEEDLNEFLDEEARASNYFVVINANELIGFFCFQKLDANIIDIGLGMKPQLTGQGNGEDFLKTGIEFGINKYKPATITLSVANFNERAINVYKKVGFVPEETFKQDTNGGTYEFLKMSYDLYKQN